MPPKDLKPTQLYMETESGERIEVSGISDIAIEAEGIQEGGYAESFIGGEAEIEIELTEDGKKQVNELFEPFRTAARNIINLLKRTYLCNNWRKMHGLTLIRRRGEKMNRNCQNCRWYRLNENIENEIGKHECYAYSLICSPLCLGYELESGCDKFEQKGNETEEEIRREWRKRMFQTDESAKLLVSAMVEREQ